MADFRRSVLGLFQQGMDAVNSAVNHVTTATRAKMDELTLQNQRKELMEKLADAAYALWQQGIQLPEELTETLVQVQEVDTQLAAAANKAAQEEPSASGQQGAEVSESAASQDKQSDEPDVPAIHVEEATEPEEPSPMPTFEIHSDDEEAWQEEERDEE